MSASFSCRCEERCKPVEQRAWVVWDRNCHHSAFNGYQRTPSDYSLVYCKACGALGRTKAKFVDQLRDESCLTDATPSGIVSPP